MSAFFFGPPGHQLFGFHHVPRGVARGAVLICPPWGGEYDFSHRALVALARRLAAGGSHVLRFDYSGTGDSWGETTEADLRRWEDDVGLATNELRTMSGFAAVDVVGLRLGGYVAHRAAQSDSRIRRVVMWDPVVDGEAWLRELRVMPEGKGFMEAGNLLVTCRFVAQVEGIGPDGLRAGSGAEVFLLLTRTRPDDDPSAGALLEDGGATLERMEQPAPWIEDESIWTGQVPVQAIGRISEWLK